MLFSIGPRGKRKIIILLKNYLNQRIKNGAQQGINQGLERDEGSDTFLEIFETTVYDRKEQKLLNQL